MRACATGTDVAAIEETLPTGASAFHRRRFERAAEGAIYLLAWVDSLAVVDPDMIKPAGVGLDVVGPAVIGPDMIKPAVVGLDVVGPDVVGPDAGLAVGHVLVTPMSKYDMVHERLGSFPEVNALGVAAAYRRRGVGRSLMLAALDVAATMGGSRLGLAVELANTPAVTLYRSLGFRRHSDVAPIDVWSWTDEGGVEHVERDACTYWTRPCGPGDGGGEGHEPAIPHR